MPGPNRTQKEFAQSYRGNLAYLRKFHVFRSLRGAVFLIVAIVSVGVALGYRHFVPKEYFSTGPISSNHAKFANNCQVCHDNNDPDLVKTLDVTDAVEKAKALKLADVTKLASLVGLNMGDGANTVASMPPTPAAHGDGGPDKSLLHSLGSLSKYDAACIKCHEPYQLHQPAANALLLREFYNEIGLVHAGSCSTCHREHEGPTKMRLPPSNNCRSCHNDPARLAEGLVLLRAAAHQASPRGEVRLIKDSTRSDGVRRYIPPRAVPHQPVAFDTFAGKHPDFGYEQPNLTDPANIKYNHSRHRQADVVGANHEQQIDCIQCHKLGADGVYMQRVSFESDCKRCHSLTFDPETPEMEIPHGQPIAVRTFLNTLASQYQVVARKRGMNTLEQQQQFVAGRVEALNAVIKPFVASGLSPAVALERRIFYQGDITETERITSKSNTTQAYPACRKCHTVADVASGALPQVALTNIADRWLTRGPFTHAPHLHMLCIDCHAQALASTKTSDILLPTKAICGDCHRPLKEKPTETTIASKALGDKNAELVAQQRKEGGIAFECQACHGKFHAPAGASVYAKQVAK